MATHRTIWPSVTTELRVIPCPADNIAQQRVMVYASEGVFSFCFPVSPETARALAADLIASADQLKPIDRPLFLPKRNTHEEENHGNRPAS